MDDRYRSLEGPAEGIFRDRNSRFLAFGFPVNTPEVANDLLTGIRKKFHDARHYCFAYRLGYAGEVFRLGDDGEPSGTAGRPIYGQLLSHELTFVLAVVVRYFGGTLLGTAGLINAYRSATADMLSRASVTEKFVTENFSISFPYDRLNPVMKILKEEHIVPVHPVYETVCTMELQVRKSTVERITSRFSAIRELVMRPAPVGD